MNPNQLKRLFPNASQSTINKNRDQGVCPPEQKPPQGKPLVRAPQREDSGGPFFEIRFTIYSVRPNDWDNPWTKTLQDCLVRAGILHDDKWDVLQGKVISQKAYSKEEERTVIELFQIKYL